MRSIDIGGVKVASRKSIERFCCRKSERCSVIVLTIHRLSVWNNLMKEQRGIMTKKILTLTLLCLMFGFVMAQQPKVTSLFSKELTDVPGKEISVITVEYPPGGSDPVHRHNAHGVIYVLEGSIVMQVKGGKEVTLKPGQTFYEGPNDIHTVGRNASKTKPAKFLVFFLKEKGAPILTPVE